MITIVLDDIPLLYYWRNDNYFRDLDLGAGIILTKSNPLLHQMRIGDSLWAFTRHKSGDYVFSRQTRHQKPKR